MRYLIDTNIFVYLATDPELLSADVQAIIQDPNNILCMSMESIKELVVAYRRKGLWAKRWRTPEDIIDSVKNEYFIEVLPIHEEHMRTFAHLTTNDAQGHTDPSDHLIISHALTERMPLISSDRLFAFYRNQGLDLIVNNK
jgi:PIN domain nuclease of toxin-antitoxin system